MRTQPRIIIFRILGIMALIGIIIFSYLKYKPLIQGPLLVEMSLESRSITDQSFVEIQGAVKNTQDIMINGRSLVLDEFNRFTKIIALDQGANNIAVDLVDIFGKEKSYLYHIYAEYHVPEFAQTYEQALKHVNENITENESLIETEVQDTETTL